VENTKSKNENIFSWILEQDRQKNRDLRLKEKAHNSQENSAKKKNNCSKCNNIFDEPKLVQYFACPHCLTKVEDEEKKSCQHWFGFLCQKDQKESVPPECVECEKVLDCMLKPQYDLRAVSEIKKWY